MDCSFLFLDKKKRTKRKVKPKKSYIVQGQRTPAFLAGLRKCVSIFFCKFHQQKQKIARYGDRLVSRSNQAIFCGPPTQEGDLPLKFAILLVTFLLKKSNLSTMNWLTLQRQILIKSFSSNWPSTEFLLITIQSS